MLAVLSTVLVTGGLHEDGLADCADGFGGGSARARKLEIMRDSRIGTYGALTLGLSLMLRVAALAGLAERGGLGLTAAGLLAAAAASRGLGLMPIALLGPARSDGLGHDAGRLPAIVFPTASALAIVLGLVLPGWSGSPLPRTALALGLATLAAAGVTELARRQVGGVTGDVAGACQQACEVALLLGLLIAPGGGLTEGMSHASSPCTGVCTIDAASAFCLGCGRTIDEILAWGAWSEPQRLAVMADLPIRLAEAGRRLTPPSTVPS